MSVEKFSDNRVFEEKSHLFALLTAVIICVLLSGLFVLNNHAKRTDSYKQGQTLESRININTCSEASLVRLQGIGPAKASAIVSYREQTSNGDPNVKVFERPEDLMVISGIGEKTVEAMKPFLIFE